MVADSATGRAGRGEVLTSGEGGELLAQARAARGLVAGVHHVGAIAKRQAGLGACVLARRRLLEPAQLVGDLVELPTDRAGTGRSGSRCGSGGDNERGARESGGVTHDDVGPRCTANGEGGAGRKIRRDERDAAATAAPAAPAAAFAATAGSGAFALTRGKLRAVLVDAEVGELYVANAIRLVVWDAVVARPLRLGADGGNVVVRES